VSVNYFGHRRYIRLDLFKGISAAGWISENFHARKFSISIPVKLIFGDTGRSQMIGGVEQKCGAGPSEDSLGRLEHEVSPSEDM